MLLELLVAEVDRVVSMVISTVPVPASLSSTTVPEVFVNLPRQIESPPRWSVSKAGKV